MNFLTFIYTIFAILLNIFYQLDIRVFDLVTPNQISEWRFLILWLCFVLIFIASLLIRLKRHPTIPPTNDLILLASALAVWVSGRIYVNQLIFEDWFHTSHDNIAAEMAAIVVIYSRARGLFESFFASITFFIYLLNSFFYLVFRDFSSHVVISFCFSFLSCSVIGWWIDGLRNADKSVRSKRQSMIKPNIPDSTQSTSR